MPRVLGEAHQTMAIQDPVSGSVITLHYRLPTSEERVAYQLAAYRLEGGERQFRLGETRLEYGLKLLVGFGAGDFLIQTKKKGIMYGLHYAHHPFDVVGWDGYCYPFAFSIHDFEPITGRVHQPPPVHQTFEAHNFVVCSFCPRLYDYHPDAIPAPYNHSNIDSDEVLYYVDGDFMSRKNVTRGMITLHPAGIPHGPHPGAVEKSIGKKETQELAVMVDTFHPLQLTVEALEIENPGYTMSWAE